MTDEQCDDLFNQHYRGGFPWRKLIRAAPASAPQVVTAVGVVSDLFPALRRAAIAQGIPDDAPLYAQASAPSVQTEVLEEHQLHLEQAIEYLTEFGAELRGRGMDSMADGCEATAHVLTKMRLQASAQPAAEPLSGETEAQRAEVCAAWNDLPDELRTHPCLARLHRALGAPQ